MLWGEGSRGSRKTEKKQGWTWADHCWSRVMVHGVHEVILSTIVFVWNFLLQNVKMRKFKSYTMARMKPLVSDYSLQILLWAFCNLLWVKLITRWDFISLNPCRKAFIKLHSNAVSFAFVNSGCKSCLHRECYCIFYAINARRSYIVGSTL